MSWLTDVQYKGKHRVLTERDHRATMALALVSAAALSSVGYGEAAGDPPGGWGAIIACESGGRNVHTAISGPFTASGYFQITNGTWARNGGLQFAPTAMQASFEEQRAVANRIYARNPSLSDWAASKSCWASGKRQVALPISSPSPAQSRTVSPRKAVPAKAKPKPAPTVARVTTPTRSTTKSRAYVVKRGDTLSRIAGAKWRNIWRLNRATIGSNPNRIYPGQRLVLS